jgi:hypothetical protein
MSHLDMSNWESNPIQHLVINPSGNGYVPLVFLASKLGSNNMLAINNIYGVQVIAFWTSIVSNVGS